jgi:superfamily I DNA and/or RNA helicase
VLGDGARVGTVDKFQGQEAEVVLISMATSSPEDVPRGIDFLYSQNRLNVSLSRARILSILVMSPQLLDVRCNTIEQMRLVNTLCWVKEYADGF